MPTATDTRARLLVAARQAFAELGYGRARVEDVVARIARNIEHAAGQGLTRPVDPLTAATALAAMAEQTMFLRAVRGEPLDRDRTVETLADLWLHALYR